MLLNLLYLAQKNCVTFLERSLLLVICFVLIYSVKMFFCGGRGGGGSRLLRIPESST